MSMISAAIALAAAIPASSDDHSASHPHAALLEEWRRSDACPKPANFEPTPAQPFFTATIGEVNGTPIYVYGVRETRIGLSGRFMSATPYYHLEWYFDRDHASAAAVLESFRFTHEAGLWVDEYDSPCRAPTAKLHEARMVQGVQIHRVVRDQFTWEFCTMHDVCRIHHAGLRDLYRPHYSPFPEISDEWEVKVPEIQECLTSRCLHCGQMISGFLVPHLPDRGSGPEMSWVATREEAECYRDRVVEYITEGRKEYLAYQSAKLERDLKLGSWIPADDLRGTARYRDLEAVLDPELVARFNELYHLGVDETTLAQATELEALTQRVKAAIIVHEGKILEEIVEGDLVPKLERLLRQHLSSCPLCKGSYDWSSNVVLDLLTTEYRLRLTCGCKGRTRGPEDDEPELLREFRHLAHYLRSDEGLRRHGSFHDIVRVEVGGAMVVRLALDFSSERISIFIDRAALKTAKGDVTASFVWATLRAEAMEMQVEQREHEVSEGGILKLHLSLDQRRGNWSGLRERDGVRTVYAVQRGHDTSQLVKGWYYCRNVGEPPASQKLDFKLVLIIPVMRVPDKHIPTETRSTTPTRPGAAPFNGIRIRARR